MRLTAGSASDVGMLRTLNEDNLLVTADAFAVADGMGGHRGGEVASALALETFDANSSEPTLDRMVEAVRAANRAVHEHARANPDVAGMGTTLCAIAPLGEDRVGVVNVGDSRVYLLRGGALFQVSEDHSFVETLVREGRLTRAQAEVHPQRNVITRALGIEPEVDVDAWEFPVASGDRFLLCSDGLFNEVIETDIELLLVGTTDPTEAAGLLVAAANAAGGRDNITCVVVDVAEVATAAERVGAIGRPINDDEQLAAATVPSSDDPTVVDEPTLTRPRGNGPAAAATPTSARRRRLTWRTWLFLGAIVAVFAAAFVGMKIVNDSTYGLGVTDGEIVVVRGSENIPFFGTTEDPTGIRVDDLTTSARADVAREHSWSSRAEADAYLARLRTAVTTAATATTTTTTSTTVAADTTTTAAVGP